MSDSLKEETLRYHGYPAVGKVAVTPTKALDNQRDLSLAYFPGVACTCQAVEAGPLQVCGLTLYANGFALPGLGHLMKTATEDTMIGMALPDIDAPVHVLTNNTTAALSIWRSSS